MKKLVIALALFALMGMAFAEEADYLFFSSDVAALTTDTLGGQDDGNAYIYARFHIAGLYFKITEEDAWACSAMVPADSVVADDGINLENTGGVGLDLRFWISDEDVDSGEWTQNATWACPNVEDVYALALVVSDDLDAFPDADDVADFAADDLLPTAAGAWYTAAGQFAPTTAGLHYDFEGATSLKLKAGPDGDDNVKLYFAVIMSDAGATDAGAHTAQIEIEARATVDN